MYTLNYRNYTPGVFFEWFKIGSAIQVSRKKTGRHFGDTSIFQKSYFRTWWVNLRKLLVYVHWHINKSRFKDLLISTYQISSVGRALEQCPWVVSLNPNRGRSFFLLEICSSSHSSFSQLGLTNVKMYVEREVFFKR